MTRRRAVLVPVLGLLVALPSIPVAAGSDPGAAPDTRLRRWEPFRNPGGFREQLRATPAAGPAATRRALLWATAELAGLEPIAAALADDETIFEDRFVVGAGDLDGDGAADALEYVFRLFDDGEDFSFESSVSAVRGQDGETLWTIDEEDGLLISAGDLDGTVGDDFFLMSIEALGGPVSVWDITFAGLRGSDGATLWTKTYRNPWTWAVAYVDVNFAVPLGIFEDADGDGSADLLVARYHIVSAGPLAHTAYTIFETLSGRDGTLAGELERLTPGGFSEAAVVPDLTGDGLDDVVVHAWRWGADYETFEGTLAAHPGTGGDAGWEVATAGGTVPYLTGLHLDGDGLGDVLLESLNGIDWDTQDVSGAWTEYGAISGADGSSLWSIEVPGLAIALPATAPSAAGTGALLVFAWQLDEDWFLLASSVRHIAGADGTESWSRSFAGESYPEPAGDVDADGTLDVAVTSYEYDPETDDFQAEAEVMSGRDASSLWTMSPLLDYLWPTFADLDGSGGDDLVVIDFRAFEDRYIGVDGRSGMPLWPASVTVDGYLTWLDSAPLRGGLGSDLLESSSDITFSESSTAARTGDEGSILWTR